MLSINLALCNLLIRSIDFKSPNLENMITETISVELTTKIIYHHEARFLIW